MFPFGINITYFDSVSGCPKSLISNVKIQVFHPFNQPSTALLSYFCCFFDGNSRGNYKLGLFVSSKAQFGITRNYMSRCLISAWRFIKGAKCTYPVPTSITQAGSFPSMANKVAQKFDFS